MNKCPVCGYAEATLNKMPSNVMNRYINKLNAQDVVVLNNTDPEVQVGPKKMIREDLYLKSLNIPKTEKPVEPAKVVTENKPLVPTTPVITKTPILQSTAPVAATAPPVKLEEVPPATQP